MADTKELERLFVISPRQRKRRKTKKDFKPTGLHHIMADRGTQSKENMDCSVRALAIVTGISYEDARTALADKGRKNRRRTPTHYLLDAVTSLGYQYRSVDICREIISGYPGKHKFKTRVTSHQMDRFPEVWKNRKTYLMFTRGHVLAIINGVNHDWSRGKSLRCQVLYEVEKVK